MPKLVTMGAPLQCTFGASSSSLVLTPENKTNSNKKPAGTIMDNVPVKNIPPFGMCSAPTNPAVATATTAAGGVLTPQPCIPAISAPWTPPATGVMINKKPALLDTCKLMCNWLGVISINNAGQANTPTPNN